MDDVVDLFHTDDISVSVDKLSIFGHASTDIITLDFDGIVFEKHYDGFFVKHISSAAENHFRELWTISYYRKWELSEELVSMAILIGWNGGNNCLTQENQRRYKIEFNPNKFDIPDWLLLIFVKHGFKVDYIKNIDLAFDFYGMPQSWFRIFPASGNTSVASIGTFGNKTDYIGFSSKSANRIKIYNKTLERKKYHNYWCDVTRVEITLDYVYSQRNISYGADCDALVKSASAVSQVAVYHADSNDAFLFALSRLDKRDVDAAMKMLSVNSRKKYKALLASVVCHRLFCSFTDLFFFLDDTLSKILKSMQIDFIV